MKYYNLFVTSLIANAIFALAAKQNLTVLSSGGIEVVGNLPSDVVDAELVCYDVKPQNISEYKKMTEDCNKINSTEKSCYVKTKSSDKELFSTVKYRTGRSCDVYTKKEGVTTVKPTYTTPIKKTVPSVASTVLSSGGIEVVGNLPSDVVDAELVCYDVKPQNISKYKKKTEDCTIISPTKKSCYVKTKSSDKALFSTVKYRTGRSCDVYTKKEGFTTFIPITKKVTVTKTITV